MSIEQLKKKLESEKKELMRMKDVNKNPDVFSPHSYEAATDRLLPLFEKAVEMAEFITQTRYGAQGYHEEQDWNGLSDYYANLQSEFSKKAREFLSEFTKMTEIKKESGK